MNAKEARERLNEIQAECDKLDRATQRAKQKHELALFDLIQAERNHAAAIQRRMAFEGRNQDILNPV